MYITDPEEIKSVARCRWNKQYFTKKRKRNIAAGAILWIIAVMILLSFDRTTFLGLGLFAIAYLIGWRWTRKQKAEVQILAEKIIREG